jgi:hypothetical protein
MFVEETRVDPKNQKMKLFTRNVSYDNVLKTEEICEYAPDPVNKLWFVSQVEVPYCATRFQLTLLL